MKRRSYTGRNGNRAEVPTFQVRLQKHGREVWFNLGTANRAEAARKAKEVYTFLEANGWDPTLEKFKPGSMNAPSGKLMVGEYLNAVKGSGKDIDARVIFHASCGGSTFGSGRKSV